MSCRARHRCSSTFLEVDFLGCSLLRAAYIVFVLESECQALGAASQAKITRLVGVDTLFNSAYWCSFFQLAKVAPKTKLGFLNFENFISLYITFNCPASILVMCQACCVQESEKHLVREQTQEKEW